MTTPPAPYALTVRILTSTYALVETTTSEHATAEARWAAEDTIAAEAAREGLSLVSVHPEGDGKIVFTYIRPHIPAQW